MANYLMFNGEKIFIPDDLAGAIYRSLPHSDFDFLPNENYYYITSVGNVLKQDTGLELNMVDKDCFYTANFCRNKQMMIKRAKQEVLNRLLWRFSQRNRTDNKYGALWYIAYTDGEYVVFRNDSKVRVMGVVYFDDENIAQEAIDTIIIPFENDQLPCCDLWKEDE